LSGILYKTSFPTIIGKIYCVYTEKGEIAFLGNDAEDLKGFIDLLIEKDGLSVKEKPSKYIKNRLDDYLSGKSKKIDLKTVLLTGSDFEKKIWSSTADIGHGQLSTYKDIASLSGNPGAYRAAGTALSKNPIFLIIPCHRVIKSDGSIGGFSSGIDLKKKLLRLEGIKI